ncbi:MAG: UDP-N-acetylglucosamine 1-carboxyvinyltransferase [Defluviitaleaceae bacterium]|nr:UDP-N-acetylglucosamine 1-carboxyvinyltransferase [Defluviitaleaceae bacterium]
MGKFVIEESGRLKGRVRISGSKNSVLPIIAATLLTDQTCTIHDVPALTDVVVMQNLIEDFGGTTRWDAGDETLTIAVKNIDKIEASYELCAKMRASFLAAGPVLARMGEVKMSLPGGCAIGSRPVDLHLKGLAALGADIAQEHGYVHAKAKKLTGANIYLDFPSVGATENIMMAAVLAKGQTIIQNCAVEPEIVDLSNFLSSMGAQIRGSGTDTIRINGVDSLSGTSHNIIPDRIEAGTFMIAAAITNGDVEITNTVTDHLKPAMAKLREAGVDITETDEGMRVKGARRRQPIDVKTLPYPGFPTDMQAQFISMLAVTPGTNIVTETVFENRFMHVPELVRMGADIKIDSRSAIIEGVERLTGTQVKATDLRAGASLILAALAATGTTEVHDIYHVDRGYFQFDEKLRGLGAKILRVDG